VGSVAGHCAADGRAARALPKTTARAAEGGRVGGGLAAGDAWSQLAW